MADNDNGGEAIKKVGNAIKKVIGKIGKHFLKYFVIVLLIFILLAGMFWGVIDGAFKELSKTASGLKESVQIVDRSIVIPEDFKEEIYKRLKAAGLDPGELNLGGNLEYLTNWMEAEIVTSYPYMGGSGLQGVITIKRGNTDGSYTSLSYTELATLESMIANGDSTAKQYFSLNGDNLVVANTNVAGDGTTSLVKYEFNYMLMVSPYSTPFEFFVALCLITQSPEFVNALANYTKNTVIEITLMESLTTTTTTTQISGTQEISTYVVDNGTQGETTTTSNPYTEEPETTVSYISSISPIVTEARTLFIEKTVEPIYTDKTQDTDPIVYDKNVLDECADVIGQYTVISSEPEQNPTKYTYQKVDKIDIKKTVTTSTRYQNWQAGTTVTRDNTDAFLSFIVNDTGQLPGGVSTNGSNDGMTGEEEFDISQVTGYARTILEKAAECKSYIAKNGFTYAQVGLSIPLGPNVRTIDCSSYVSWVMYEAGYKGTFSGHQWTASKFGSNPLGWQVIYNFNDIQPGDIIVMNSWGGTQYGHVQIYAGNGKHFNCGYQDALRIDGPTSGARVQRDFNLALRPSEPSEAEQNGAASPTVPGASLPGSPDVVVEGIYILYNVPGQTAKQSPKENLVNGAALLFKLLGSNERTQIYETVMRYILYRLTGRSYGVTELDLSIFGSDSLNSASSGVTGLGQYLRQFAHSGEAPQSADGKYYKMYGDGVGWPTIGLADIQWKSHHAKFNVPGKVLSGGQELSVDSIEEYVGTKLSRGHEAKYSNAEVSAAEIYVEKGIVDEIGDQLYQNFINYVDSKTQGIELSKQQKYALCHIVANFGHLPVRDGKTFKQVYEEGAALYEINSWEHNRYIWDNWWCKLGGGAPGHIYSRDATFETYVKGVFDFSTSPAGKLGARTHYIYYTPAQLAQFSYAPNKPTTRTAANEKEIFTYVERSGGTEGSTDISGYTFKTYTSSNGKTYTWYLQDYGPWVGQKSGGGSTMAAAGCYCTTASTIASGYGSTALPGWNRNIYEFNLTSRQLGSGCPGGIASQLSESQLNEIRNHLRKGGEVIVHVQGAKRGGSSSYTSNQHWMPIVDVNDDGSQVFNMNTTSSSMNNGKSGWVDIKTLFSSVNCYHLVNGKR